MYTKNNGSKTLSSTKKALLEKITKGIGTYDQNFSRSGDTEYSPLTYGQQRLWFVNKLDPSNSAYDFTLKLKITGYLDNEIMLKSLNALRLRHQALCIRIIEKDGEPWQKAFLDDPLDYKYENLENYSAEEQKDKVNILKQEKAFDIRNDILFRVRLFKLNSSEHILVFHIHHIIFDGWSIDIFMNDLFYFYEKFEINEQPALSNKPDNQYVDYAIWQRKFFKENLLESQLAYWRNHLSGNLPQLTLNSLDWNNHTYSLKGACESKTINERMSLMIKNFCKSNNISYFIFLKTVFNLLLQKHSDQEEIILGMPVANRNNEDFENTVGMFVNILAIRTNLSGNPSFLELLERVKTTCFDAYANQEVPFEKIVEEINPDRKLHRNPIFDVMINYVQLQSNKQNSWNVNDLTISLLDDDEIQSNFLMTLYITENNDEFNLNLVYQEHMFSKKFASILMEQLEHLIEQAITRPNKKLSEYNLITKSTRNFLPSINNKIEKTNYTPLLNMVYESVYKYPNKICIEHAVNKYSYLELYNTAKEIARIINEYNLQKNDVVAIVGQRSFLFISAMLAIWMNKLTLLNIDESLPDLRKKQMMQAGKAKVVVYLSDQKSIAAWKSEFPFVDVISITEDNIIKNSNVNDIEKQTDIILNEDVLAYIFFTSGSTGNPKGVLGTHQGLSHFLCWQKDTFNVSSVDRFAQLTNVSFDVVLRDIFLPLISGATIVIPDEVDELGADLILPWLKQQEITRVHLVPSLLNTWMASHQETIELNRLLTVFLAGEPLYGGLLKKFKSLTNFIGQFVNLYGPTETTLAKCFEIIKDEISDTVQSVGKALPQSQVFVINEHNEICGVGEMGEIVIRTPYRTQGYINDTNEQINKFKLNPYSNDKNDLLYYSGDIGFYLPDGRLQIKGRKDDQIKINGTRIELNEINTVLIKHPNVLNSIVQYMKRNDLYILTAYIVTDKKNIDISEIKQYLREYLPNVMIPLAYEFLDEIPLLPNGKVDRRKLPLPLMVDSDYVHEDPTNDIEKNISLIWSEVLKRDRVGILDNFFNIGGHSLLAIQVLTRIRKHFEVDLSLKNIFEFPTIKKLSAYIQTQEKSNNITPISVSKNNDRNFYPLSFIQEQFMFLQHFKLNNSMYNVPILLKIHDKLNIEALTKSITEVLNRHQVLKINLKIIDNKTYQYIQERSIQEIFEYYPDQFCRHSMMELVSKESERPFDLYNDSLIRIKLISVNQEEHYLFLNFHHIVVDVTSLNIFLNELFSCYENLSQNKPINLPIPSLQYLDYANWQHEQENIQRIASQLDYWRNQLGGTLPKLQLPVNKITNKHIGESVSFEIDIDTTRKLKQISYKNGASLFITMLTAFSIILNRYSSQDEILIGTAVSLRDQEIFESQIGPFINTLILRIKISEGNSFLSLLDNVKKVCLDAFLNKDVPLQKVIEAINPGRSIDDSSIYQVMIELHPFNSTEITTNMELMNINRKETRFPLHLKLIENEENKLTGILEYNKDLFEHDIISNMVKNFLFMINEIIIKQENDHEIKEIEIISLEDKNSIIYDRNNTYMTFPKHKCIHHLFEEQVSRTPNEIAIECGEKQYSYYELNQRADQLAFELTERGIALEEKIGVCMERSFEMIVAILGILKAGGAYVPLDPALPDERIQYICKDASIQISYTQQNLVNKLPAYVEKKYVDNYSDEESANKVRTPLKKVSSNNLAYVIYTSGTTGYPKGTMIAHSSLVNYVVWSDKVYNENEKLNFAFYSSLSFDLTVTSIFVPLISGNLMVIFNGSDTGKVLQDIINNSQINIIKLTPAHLQLLEYIEIPNADTSLQKLIVGGEQLHFSVASKISNKFNGNIKIYNEYGPTEATVGCMTYLFDGAKTNQNVVPIGVPGANVQVYILDKNGNVVPDGVIGELFIAGEGLSRGYLNQEKLTADKFIDNPFVQNTKMYRTGDLAKWIPDGNVEYVGRLDHQIKLNGFRIELGEVEALLCEHPSVKEAIVVISPNQQLEKELVAFVVGEVQSEQLSTYLKTRLPHFMLPSQIILIDSMPLTPNGKIDRSQLLNYEVKESKRKYEPPRTILEMELVQIWEEVIGVTPIGIQDDFFAVGGHSIKAFACMAIISRKYNLDIPVSVLFDNPTIQSFSNIIKNRMDVGNHSKILIPLFNENLNNEVKNPIFLIHPGGGGIISYFNLARSIGEKANVYGIQAVGLEDQRKPLLSIYTMANYYLEEIKSVTKKGMYNLAGWSFGGFVAYEIARLVEQQQEHVKLLAILDSFLEHTTKPGHVRVLSTLLKQLGIEESSIDQTDIETIIKLIYEQSVKQNKLQPWQDYESMYRQLIVAIRNAQAIDEYYKKFFESPKINSDIHLFRVSEVDSTNSRPLVDLELWESRTKGKLYVHSISGNHNNLLDLPHVNDISSKFLNLLND